MKRKPFDAVEMMRRLRDDLSAELAPLSPEQQRELIHERASKFPVYRNPTEKRAKDTRGQRASAKPS